MYAPIVLFVYNRPIHTQKTLDALAKNDLARNSLLFIFSDGPLQNAASENIQKVEEVRRIIRNENRFAKVTIIESPLNKGLAASIIIGVTQIVNEFGRVIVLEDDIMTNKFFLKFCNEGLNKYQSFDSVKAISGFMFPVGRIKPDTFFLPTVACWGWATWKDRWKIFSNDAFHHLSEIKSKNKISEFNSNNAYDYFGLLKAQCEGRVDSWAICWYASIFLKNGLTLYPSISLTQNIGMDGTGTHYKGTLNKKEVSRNKINLTDSTFGGTIHFTDNTEIDKRIEKLLQKYLKKIYSQGAIQKIKTSFKRILLKSNLNLLKRHYF